MEKFVKKIQSLRTTEGSEAIPFLRDCFNAFAFEKRLTKTMLLGLLTIALSGCASVQVPGYISRVDHPYDRKIYAGFEKVAGAVTYVLKKRGWKISEESEPSLYERDDRYDNNGYQNLLIVTSVRKQNRILYSTFTHLNVFIHSIGNTSDVEIRYEARTPMVKQMISVRNDRMVQDILDAVEQEVSR